MSERLIIQLSGIMNGRLNEHVFIYAGDFHHERYGKFKVGEKEMDSIIMNWENGVGTQKDEKGKKVLVCNYDHPDGKDTDPEKNKNSGLIYGLKKVGKKIIASIWWTDKAREYIKKKEFLWMSPEWHPNWKDENGKEHGPTGLGAALTNYPHLKANQLAVALTDDSRIILEEQVFECECIECGWKTESREHCSDIKCEKCGGQMRRAERPGPGQTKKQTEWTAKYINDLPDASFAFIRPGGDKDEDGKTIPRSLRFLPFKDANGKIDLPHLRNALARLSQTKLTPAEKAKARKKLVAAARKEGVGEYTNEKGDLALFHEGFEPIIIEAKNVKLMERAKDMDLTEEKIRELLGIDEKVNIEETIKKLVEGNGDQKVIESMREALKIEDSADILQTVKDLSAKVSDQEQEIKKLRSPDDGTVVLTKDKYDVLIKGAETALELKEEKTKRDAEDLVDGYIKCREPKLSPSGRDNAIAMALIDSDRFKKLMDAQPVILELKRHGSEGAGPEGEADERVQLTTKIKERAKKDEISFTEARDRMRKEDPEQFKIMETVEPKSE